MATDYTNYTGQRLADCQLQGKNPVAVQDGYVNVIAAIKKQCMLVFLKHQKVVGVQKKKTDNLLVRDHKLMERQTRYCIQSIVA